MSSHVQSISRRFTGSVLVLGVLWLILAEGDLSSWVVAVPTILLAGGTLLLWPATRPARIRPLGVVQFAAVFAFRCLVAGIDVSRRAFGPRSAIAPGIVHYQLQLPDAASRAFLANTVSLLPGTLSVSIDGDDLHLHVLDRRSDSSQEIAMFERLVARLLHRSGVEGPLNNSNGAST